MKRILAITFCLQTDLWAQEASSGFELRVTASEQMATSGQLQEEPRDGSPVTGGFRAMLYPTWKIDDHWSVKGVVQVHSRPYFFDEFSTQGYGVKADILQANLSYSRFWNGGSMDVRAGALSSAFGSFLLRYDDATNPMIDMPMSYGYYGAGVTSLGLTGAQVDVTRGSVDVQTQFVNSSPANRRKCLRSRPIRKLDRWGWVHDPARLASGRVGVPGSLLVAELGILFSGGGAAEGPSGDGRRR